MSTAQSRTGLRGFKLPHLGIGDRFRALPRWLRILGLTAIGLLL